MSKKKLILLAASLLSMTFCGCSSNLDSGGDKTGADTTLASAATVGMDNCLTCHSPFSDLVQDYLISRHGNHMTAAAKQPNDTETPRADPSPGLTSCTLECHDPFGDGAGLNLTEIQAAIDAFSNTAIADWTVAAQVIGCEACHGGGQFHNGIAAGIPFAVPGPGQCGNCHGATMELAEAGPFGSQHTTSSSGNNVRRNIFDSHYDDPDTSKQNDNEAIEGYTIRYAQQNGCVDCHFGGHLFDLTKNYQWGNSGHGGHIKAQKDAALAAGLPVGSTDEERLALLNSVTAAAVNSETGDAWIHYDWDNTARRGSCQVCHTSTGISNFLDDPENYDTSGLGNDYSHLEGWVADDPDTPDVIDNVSSGQNEMLFCWGCHSDSEGNLRNPGAIPLDYTYNDVQVVLPDVAKSNVCVKCHGGRGNNDSIRSRRSTRAAEHHAPTAASLLASYTHSGFEYDDQDYTGIPTHASIDTGSTGKGPCVSCHMGGGTEAAADQENHTFEATEHDSSGNITTINHLTTCNTSSCHNGAMSVAALQNEEDGFDAAFDVLADLIDNTTTNYLNLDIADTDNGNYKTVPLNAYGAFQNWKYMSEDPCAYVHNNLYARRLLFDSIDWMMDGDLDGTLNLMNWPTAALFLNGTTLPTAVTRP